MFTRVKQSRGGDYLQVVESYRDQGRVRQRSVLYVGHYDSLDDALEFMQRDLRLCKRRARRYAKAEWSRGHAERERREAQQLEHKIEEIKNLLAHNPQLLERDRERVVRRERQVRERIEAVSRERAKWRNDQHRTLVDD